MGAFLSRSFTDNFGGYDAAMIACHARKGFGLRSKDKTRDVIRVTGGIEWR